MSQALPADSLSPREAYDLRQCEEVIEQGLTTFYAVGEALLTIRDARLYRQTHATFEEYCRQRWGMTPQHAGRLAAAAEVVKSLEPIGSIPANEAQTRALAPLTPEERQKAWDRAQELADGKRVTAALVAQAVAEVGSAEAPPEVPADPAPFGFCASCGEVLKQPFHITPKGRECLTCRWYGVPKEEPEEDPAMTAREAELWARYQRACESLGDEIELALETGAPTPALDAVCQLREIA